MDESDHDLFASPGQKDVPETPRPHTPANARFDAEEAREAALRKELEGVRNINQVVEGVLSTLDKAKGNMSTVSHTVNNASTLLNTWTRILSQTEHNQRLILNPNWRGAGQDLVDMENEAVQKQQAAERRAAEDERRREEARRRAEEEERRRQVASTAAPRARGPRGRGRGGGRGVSGYSAGGTVSGSSSRGTGVGRGVGTRGRRGVR